MKISSFFVSAFAISFLLMNLFGVSMLGMGMDGHGETGHCTFMGETVICKMTIFEHVSAWQQMFTTVFQKTASTVIIFFIISSVAFILQRYIFSIFELFSQEWQRLLRIQPCSPVIFTYLELIFKRGILNPKIY